MKTAYFVLYPRTIDDLKILHFLDAETPYEIVKEILLSPMDYQNFITDFVADREFIEDNANLCTDAKIIKCLYVHIERHTEGILVVPDPNNTAFVKLAAYIKYLSS